MGETGLPMLEKHFLKGRGCAEKIGPRKISVGTLRGGEAGRRGGREEAGAASRAQVQEVFVPASSRIAANLRTQNLDFQRVRLEQTLSSEGWNSQGPWAVSPKFRVSDS